MIARSGYLLWSALPSPRSVKSFEEDACADFRSSRDVNNEGPLTRPFVVLSGGNDEFAVFDGDAHLLTGEESGVFDPST